MFYDKYPVGHPKYIYNPKEYDKDWYGMVKCKVLGPRGLYFPVLPDRLSCANSDKLVFHTCK